MKLNLITMTALAVILTGCKVDTPDGKVPEKYLGMVEKYTGVYEGTIKTMDGKQQATIELDMKDGRPMVHFIGSKSSDVLGERCQSVIGKMSYFKAKKKDKRLKEIHFAFGRGYCRNVDNLGFSISFSKKKPGEIYTRVGISKAESDGTCWPPENAAACTGSSARYYVGTFQKQ